jgi:hypothetical protein
MLPIKRRDKGSDQRFSDSERLYKRVPPEHLTPDGEIEPSLIQCSFGKGVKSAPSVLRSKYGTARDALRSPCANGKDVSAHVVFYVKVAGLPKQIVSGDNKSFDFYPFHDPDDDCYAHTVIACRTGEGGSTDYSMPSNAVKNKFKATLVSALKRAPMLPFPLDFACELRKFYAIRSAPKLHSTTMRPPT